MKHWLITGGSGYIGSQLLFELEESGFHCINLDIEESPLRDRNMRNVKNFIADARDGKTLDRFMQNAEGVIHLAGYKYAAKSVREPGDAFEANFVSTLRVLESMKKNHIKNFIFASSCSLYGSSREESVSEDSDINLESPYSQSKYFSEKLIDSYAKSATENFDISHTSLRLFNVAGTGSSKIQDKSPHNLFPIIQNKITSQSSLDIFGNEFNTPDGTAIRDYIFVEEVTRAIRIVMERMSHNRKVSSIINIGSGVETSVLQVVDAFNQVLGHPLKYSFQSPRPGEPSRVVADISRAKSELGWIPKVTLKEIIKTIESQEIKEIDKE